MLLASVADILSQLGFDNMTDVTNAVTLGMDAAEATLSSILETEFDQQTLTDTFYVRSPPYRDGQAVETQFRLSRGLVTSLSSVRMSYQISDFADASSYIDVTASVSAPPNDMARGVIKDFETHYMRQYVQITYTAGFASDPSLPGPPASYLVSSVPDWLQNAAKTQTLINIADHPALTEAQIKLDKNMLAGQLTNLIARRRRYAPISLLPL